MEAVRPGDADLAILAAAGDVEAMAGLLERYRPSLYAAAIGLLRDRDEALDAVQDTYVTAILRLASLRDPGAVGGWLHAVLRNACLMRLRSARRQAVKDPIDLSVVVPSPEEVLERHALGEWVWTALNRLSPDDRLAVVLRYFTRSDSYEAIAAVCAVPVGTVRSRLHRARSLLQRAVRADADGLTSSRRDLERARREEWQDFYDRLHEAPVPRTYRDTYASDVEVTDGTGRWRGVGDWSAHERQAIQLGVRATIVGIAASQDITILEIDFTNPSWAADHCPPRSTFVHQLALGRSHQLDIHYV
jgi:RNA polymerase sigma factor (sigma-70 family)